MKKFLTLRNVIICSAALIGLIVFFLSFAVKAQASGVQGGHQMLLVFDNSIWGAKEIHAYQDGQVVTSFAGKGGIAALPLIGFILLLVGVLGGALVAFLVNKPYAKWIILGCGALAVLGGVFQFFGGEACYSAYAAYDNITIEESKTWFQSFDAKVGPGALGIVLAILSILVGGGFVASQFVPEKSLVK